MTRFFAALCSAFLLLLTGCGYPKHIDPPTLTYPSQQMAEESAYLHARDLPNGPGLTLLIIPPTHSMAPTIDVGDIIVVDTHAPYSERVPGEIVTYFGVDGEWKDRPKDSPPITHRISSKHSDGFIMTGDNNRYSESRSRVTETNYVGLVVGIYRVSTK
jgi:hypothetical protein